MFQRFAMACVCAVLATGACADRIVVFAAASLGPVLEEVAEVFATSGHEAVISPAGSSVLARQVVAGAPADLFVSANEAWMDAVAPQVVPGTRVDIASNKLVVVGQGDPGPIAEVLSEGRVAMGLVEAVPVGLYGRAALEQMGLWDNVAPRVVQADNARAALSLVALGAVERGVVYATDARDEPRVQVLAEVPAGAHPPIRYPAALVRESEAARAFLALLSGPEGQAILQRHGFGAP